MRRLLVHFYVFLLLAIIGLGWSLEQVWRDYQPEIPPWFSALEQSVLTLTQQAESPEALQSTLDLSVLVVGDGRIGWPETEQQRLDRGEALTVFSADQSLYLYVKKGEEVWRIGPIADGTPSSNYWYHILFFVLLALLTTLWLRPLARDLRALESSLNTFAKDPARSLHLPKRSLVQGLSQSFERMRLQILHLLGLQRELTSAVSHDLRTPLARMKFILEMQDSPEFREALRDNVQEMETLVDTLLDYARLEGQQEFLELSAVNLSELAENLAEKLNPLPGPEISLNVPETLIWQCDGHYMERAIQNLIQNARRHAQGRVSVTLERRAKTVMIHIDDDGPGIAEHERERILKPFVRLEPSRSRHSGGVGLGLTIVQRIMEWHHGHMVIGTSPLGGARFTLTLPDH
ncbi:ATP-binding protein [Aliidiomarina sanyensis]|uniref:histidine kinase n=1 Tax=Aliidiomarina sanyensis TaxID=1249555 RepID=A0A432WBQ4_9GAMM|nr:ATP-binding protein [Aliidiomarina sanyensis]RUO29504.1 two-component sensor histidine kinase [Aliidiomarina sanyensis]